MARAHEDASAAGLSPSAWAQKAVALYRRLNAGTLAAEVNRGGEMVRSVLREVDPSVPLKEVCATRGKYIRAESVAALYGQGKAKRFGLAFMMLPHGRQANLRGYTITSMLPECG